MHRWTAQSAFCPLYVDKQFGRSLDLKENFNSKNDELLSPSSADRPAIKRFSWPIKMSEAISFESSMESLHWNQSRMANWQRLLEAAWCRKYDEWIWLFCFAFQWNRFIDWKVRPCSKQENRFETARDAIDSIRKQPHQNFWFKRVANDKKMDSWLMKLINLNRRTWSLNFGL